MKPSLMIRYPGEDFRRVFKTRTEAVKDARVICSLFQYPFVDFLHEDGRQETIRKEDLK